MEDNQCQSSSVRHQHKPSWRALSAVVADRAQHLAAIWCLYGGVGPTRQAIDAVMDAMLPPHSPSTHPLALPLSLASPTVEATSIATESFASSSRPLLRVASPLRVSLSPPSSPPLGYPRFPRGEPHFSSSPSSGSRPSRPQLRRTSPLLHPCLLSSVVVCVTPFRPW